MPIVVGFGTQVALVSELRRRHRLHHGAAAASGAGHHREGKLQFDPAGPAMGRAQLVLAGFPEPVDVAWDLES